MAGKTMMLAGGIVEPGGGSAGSVCAYVVLSAGPASRLFKVRGAASAPEVSELPSATTIDLARFKRDVEDELGPALAELRKQGGTGAIAAPKAEWLCKIVEAHVAKGPGVG